MIPFSIDGGFVVYYHTLKRESMEDEPNDQSGWECVGEGGGRRGRRIYMGKQWKDEDQYDPRNLKKKKEKKKKN